MTRPSKIPPAELEKKLEYSFKKKTLLKRALTHKSYANEHHLPPDHDNERLEFLGDAVLELGVSEFLMERFPHFDEGNLSKLRAAIVNEKQLAELARSLDLGTHLYLGKGEELTSGREKNSILSDSFEAVLGAVYLDRGYKRALALIRLLYGKLLDQTPEAHFYKDFKTELQERSQGLYRSIPHYRLVAEEGPDHEKTFEIEIFIREQSFGRGRGKSKKEAEQAAARMALEKIGN